MVPDFLFAGLDKGDGEQSEHSPYLQKKAATLLAASIVYGYGSCRVVNVKCSLILESFLRELITC